MILWTVRWVIAKYFRRSHTSPVEQVLMVWDEHVVAGGGAAVADCTSRSR